MLKGIAPCCDRRILIRYVAVETIGGVIFAGGCWVSQSCFGVAYGLTAIHVVEVAMAIYEKYKR